MFLVVFRNRKRAGFDAAAYARQADEMERLARQQAGYRSFKSFVADDGEVVAISEWESAEAARAWGRVAEHRVAQRDGRERWYAEYTLLLADEPRIRRFTAREET